MSDDQAERPSSADRGFDFKTRLDDREERGLRRDLTPIESVRERSRYAEDPGADQPVFGKQPEMVVFGSNNYLGLATDERVQRAAGDAAHSIGTGAGASRLVTGDTPVHRALERDLAEAKGTERALVFSSGYAANVGTITALDPDVVFSDAYNHASIIDGCRLSDAETVVYDHCDATALSEAMADRAPKSSDESWLVVTDSVFSMDGDVAPLSAVCDAAERYGAWVMVDEAHATGVFEDGGGIVQREGLTERVDVQLGTLSKALAAQGGFVAASEPVVEHLSNVARSFVFSTGLSPPAAGAARTALSIARNGSRRTQLWDNVERLRTGLESLGLDVMGTTHILPVVVGDRSEAVELATHLTEAGIIAPAIRPPTVPDGQSRIRLAPMATHTERDIEQCVTAFERAEGKR
ncbi:aminotransferase class I/II-fold pyridoxal phosphate-dependent enzyme [Halocatena pleomorpha]|uniref:8-amino-7-oxononanoate synthase n=1 Tax=Halocatena pleomorpha TaxID=1785090 RepID=A0A3P3RLR5_9EURY|nr:8-amino-7-oxononanoate synthase [Halocatena pleomorpha]RRJ33749.1 8-amino-7-oxononanoate synthase [Halocatena pleomorpha]